MDDQTKPEKSIKQFIIWSIYLSPFKIWNSRSTSNPVHNFGHRWKMTLKLLSYLLPKLRNHLTSFFAGFIWSSTVYHVHTRNNRQANTMNHAFWLACCSWWVHDEQWMIKWNLKQSMEKIFLLWLKYLCKSRQIWYFVTKIVLTYCEKNCSSNREKLLKFEAEGREFAKILRSLEQFIQIVKVQNNFW